MKTIVKVKNKVDRVTLEVRIYKNNADRRRALKQIKCYKVWFQDVQGPAIQLIRDHEKGEGIR